MQKYSKTKSQKMIKRTNITDLLHYCKNSSTYAGINWKQLGVLSLLPKEIDFQIILLNQINKICIFLFH